MPDLSDTVAKCRMGTAKKFYTSIASLSHTSKGTGLIVSGRKIIPFDRRVPKDSAIYKLCQTDFRREI